MHVSNKLWYGNKVLRVVLLLAARWYPLLEMEVFPWNVKSFERFQWMLFFKILYFCSISVAEGDTWTMKIFCTTIPARGELAGHHKYEKWTEYEARWVLDKAEVSNRKPLPCWQPMQDSGMLQCWFTCKNSYRTRKICHEEDRQTQMYF